MKGWIIFLSLMVFGVFWEVLVLRDFNLQRREDIKNIIHTPIVNCLESDEYKEHEHHDKEHKHHIFGGKVK